MYLRFQSISHLLKSGMQIGSPAISEILQPYHDEKKAQVTSRMLRYLEGAFKFEVRCAGCRKSQSERIHKALDRAIEPGSSGFAIRGAHLWFPAIWQLKRS